MLRVTATLLRVLRGAEESSLGLAVLAMWAIIIFGTTTRYVLTGITSTAWVDVTCRLLLAFTSFWGGAVVLRERGHFDVNLVVRRLSPRLQFWVTGLADTIVMAVLAVIVWESLGIIPRQMNQFTGGELKIPVGVWPLLLMASSVMMLYYLLSGLAKKRATAFASPFKAKGEGEHSQPEPLA